MPVTLIIILIICTFLELKRNSFSVERASKRKGRMVGKRGEDKDR